MDWTEVTVSVDAKDVDRAGDIAQMVVPYGIYVEDYSHLEEEAWEIAHIDLIDEELLKKDRTKALVHVYISPCLLYTSSGVQVIDVVMPSGGPTQLHGIATEDSEEIQKLLGLLDQYPTNRKWDWSWLLGEGFGDYNGKDPYSSVWVVLSFRDADGKAGSLQYIVSETGRVQVFEPNRFGDVPAGVGRFGAEGAKQYFAALHRFYEQKVDSPLWALSLIHIFL